MSKRGLQGLLTSLPGTKKAKIEKPKEQELHVEQFGGSEGETRYKNKGYVQGPIDSVSGQRSAFPITLHLDKVNLQKVPENVYQYLAQVRLEAYGNRLHAGGYSDNEDEDDYNYDDNDDCVFYQRSKSVGSEGNEGKECQGEINQSSNGNGEIDVELAKTTFETAQDDVQYIIGKEYVVDYIAEYKSERKKYEEFRMNLHELDAIDLPQTAKAWKKFIREVSCEPEYIAQIIEEEEHHKLLVYFGKWLTLKVEENYKEWLFAFLAAIEEVVTPAEISTLRQLAKKALRQLEIWLVNEGNTNSNENVDHRDTYKKILAIVGIFYKQKDLIV